MGRGSQREGNLCNTSVIALQYLANQTKDLSLKRNQWRRERCIHQGDTASGRQAAQGWEGGWDWNNTNCRSGERAWLIDGVEPHRDWALTDDVSTVIDWCQRAPVLLKHSPTVGVTLNSLLGWLLFVFNLFFPQFLSSGLFFTHLYLMVKMFLFSEDSPLCWFPVFRNHYVFKRDQEREFIPSVARITSVVCASFAISTWPLLLHYCHTELYYWYLCMHVQYFVDILHNCLVYIYIFF